VTGVCDKAYPQQFSKIYKIRFGTKTIYNRDLSRSWVCTGAFGAPGNGRPTIAAACDLILAAYKVKNAQEGLDRLWLRAGIRTRRGLDA
jgi:hypothetical protein